MRNSLLKVSFRFTGAPPATGAARIEVAKWIRGIYLRMLVVSTPVWVLVALGGVPTWAWIPLGAGAAIWLQGFVSLNLRIKRLRNDPVGTASNEP